MGLMTGEKSKVHKMQALSPLQRDIFKHFAKKINPKMLDIMENPLFQQAQTYLSDFLSKSPEELAKPYEQQAMTQFRQEIMPEISTRFAGMGGLESSGFQQAMGGAGADLASRMAMLRSGFQQQQLGALPMAANFAQQPVTNTMGMLGQALNTPMYNYQVTQGQPGMAQGIASGVGSGMGMAAGFGLKSLFGV
jgi:hypothetical protein